MINSIRLYLHKKVTEEYLSELRKTEVEVEYDRDNENAPFVALENLFRPNHPPGIDYLNVWLATMLATAEKATAKFGLGRYVVDLQDSQVKIVVDDSNVPGMMMISLSVPGEYALRDVRSGYEALRAGKAKLQESWDNRTFPAPAPVQS